MSYCKPGILRIHILWLLGILHLIMRRVSSGCLAQYHIHSCENLTYNLGAFSGFPFLIMMSSDANEVAKWSMLAVFVCVNASNIASQLLVSDPRHESLWNISSLASLSFTMLVVYHCFVACLILGHGIWIGIRKIRILYPLRWLRPLRCPSYL